MPELRIDSANAEELAGLHSWFDAVTRDLPGSMHYGMRLALEEAVMNVAMHAFPPSAGGEISVRLRMSSGAATLCVEDAGPVFDPTAAPVQKRPASLLEAEPGGLGLTLLRHYCQDITYERIGDRNRLTLRFPLPPA